MSFSFSEEHLSLVDVKSKEKHKKATGYDYEKPIQQIIKTMAEYELMGVPPRSNGANRNVLPRAGKQVLNGVEIVITRQDLEAFKAAYPQTAVTGSKRIQAIEILQAGNSTLDESSITVPKNDKLENNSDEAHQNTNPSENDETTSESGCKIKILEYASWKVLQVKGFESEEKYKEWLQRQDIIDRTQTVALSPSEGFNFDVSFGKQVEPKHHLQSISGETSNIKIRILDLTFKMVKSMTFTVEKYKEWYSENLDSVVVVMKSTEKDYTYDIRLEEAVIQQPPQPEPPVVSKTPTYPPEPTEATHEILAPSVWALFEPSDKSEFKHEPKKGDKIIVHDENVGTKGRFCEVTLIGVESDRVYIDNSFVKKLDDIEETFPIKSDDKRSFRSTKTPEKIWYKQKDKEPYYDSSDAKHKVCLITDVDSFGENPETQIQEIYKRYLPIGLEIILTNEGKHFEEETISALIETESYNNVARTEEFYFASKADSKLRVLVTICHKHLALLDDADEDDYGANIIIDYKLDSLREDINKVSKKIESCEKGISSFEGKVEVFDAKEEALRIMMITDTIFELLEHNEVKPDKKKRKKYFGEFLTIGWKDAKIVFITHINETQDKETRLIKNFPKMRDKVHMSAERTQHFFQNLKDILQGGMKLNWRQFIKKYAFYNEVKFTQKDELNKLSEAEGPIEQTNEQKEKEDRFYSNKERRIAAVEKRKKEKDNTKNPRRYNGFGDVAERMGTELEDVYANVLTQFDITNLAMVALSCLNANPEFDFKTHLDFKGAISDYDKITEELERAWNDVKGVFTGTTSLKFWDDLPTDDIVDAFIGGLGDGLEQMAKSLIIGLVKGILNSLGDFCRDKEEGGALGPQSVLDALPDIMPSLKPIAEAITSNPDYSPEEMADFLTDLGAILTLTEYCQLLAGTASGETMGEVMHLLDSQYCKLGLDTPAKVVDFFRGLGDTGTFEMCEPGTETPSKSQALSPWEQLCPEPGGKARVLSAKGLTDEQLAEQLESERQKTNALVEEILNSFKDGGLLSGTAEAPPTFCTQDENGNVTPGQFSFMHPAMKEDLSTTIESLLKPVYDSFQAEGAEFSQTYIGTRQVDKIIFEEVELGAPLNATIERKKTVKVPQRFVLPQIKKSHDMRVRVEPVYGSENISDAMSMQYKAYQNEIFSLPCDTSDEELKEAVNALTSVKRYLDTGMTSKTDNIISKVDEVKETLYSDVKFAIKSPCEVYDETRGAIMVARSLAAEYATRDNLQAVADLRVEVTSNSEDTNEERQEQCKKELKFSMLPTSLFATFLSEMEKTEQEQENPVPPAREGIETDIDIRPITGVVENECQEGFIYQEISTIVKKYQIKKEIEPIVQAAMTFTPYTQKEDKYRPLSAFHQLIKLNCPYASQQNAIDDFKYPITQVFNKMDMMILDHISQSVVNNKYGDVFELPFTIQGEEPSQFYIELVDLGPLPTPECDPHLLKLKQLSEEAINEFQSDYCAATKGGKIDKDGNVKKTPLETSMMRICIKATLRHYLIDFYSRAIFSISAFKDSDGRILFEYIIDKIISEIMKYGGTYVRDFTRELVLIDKNRKEGDTVRDSFSRMLKAEWEAIRDDYKEALLSGEESSLTMKESISNIFTPVDIDSNGFFRLEIGEDMRYEELVNRLAEYERTGDNRQYDLRREIEREYGIILGVCHQYYYEGTEKYYNFDEGMIAALSNPESDLIMKTSLVAIITEDSPYYNQTSELPNFSPYSVLHNERYKGLFFNGEFLDTSDAGTFNHKSAYVFPIISRTSSAPMPSRAFEEISRKLLFTEETLGTKMLFEYACPISRYLETMIVHEMECNTKILSMALGFGATRDNLKNLFYTVLPEEEWWKKQPDTLKGLPTDIIPLFTMNFALNPLPCIDLKWNFGLDFAGWGNPFKGIDFNIAFKMAIEASLTIFKDWAERNDPNLILAKRLSFLTSLACIDISTRDYSVLLQIPFPGNPYITTPLNAAYNALGLGALSAKFAKDSSDKDKVKEKLEEKGFRLPSYCSSPPTTNTDQARSLSEYAEGEEPSREASVRELSEKREMYQRVQELQTHTSGLEARIRELSNTSDSRYWEVDADTLNLRAKDENTWYVSPTQLAEMSPEARAAGNYVVAMETADYADGALNEIEAGVSPYQYSLLPASLRREAIVVFPRNEDVMVMNFHGIRLLEEATASLEEVKSEIERLETQIYDRA